MATESLGDAFIDVHANTRPFDRELDGKLEKAAKDAEADLNRAGTDMGDVLGEAISKEVGKKGPTFGKSIERALQKVTVFVKSKVNFDRIKLPKRDALTSSIGDGVGDSIVKDIDRALVVASRPGGPFSRIGTAIADAIGAGFNVSGRSPLIAVLIPALAALVGLIVAALQIVNSLVAVLVTVPALISAIGLQVGVVIMAFNGVGEAAKKAFAAKNAKELQEAVKGLTPAAQEFVRNLLPIRDFFRVLGRITQENFFKAFGPELLVTVDVLNRILKGGFAQLATAMGTLFAQLAEMLRSPVFQEFLKNIFPATVQWLQGFGPALVSFITGLIAIADKSLPFLNVVGTLVNSALTQMGDFFLRMSEDPAFQAWLSSMKDTLESVFQLFAELIRFVTIFLAQLDKAGGLAVLDALVDAISQLSFFLASPAGLKAMEALVNLSIIGIQSFTGLVIAIMLVMAAIELVAEGFNMMWRFVVRVVQDLIRWFTDVRRMGSAQFGAFLAVVRAVPGQVLAAFRNVGALLVRAGQNIVQGLVNGVLSRLNYLRDIMRYVMGLIGNFLPGSPAKEGPLSGRGYTKLRGSRMMKDFLDGVRSEASGVRSTMSEVTSSVVFGPNSIQMQFSGPTPDQSQARTVGRAMGSAAAEMIAARNTRLAVRTI